MRRFDAFTLSFFAAVLFLCCASRAHATSRLVCSNSSGVPNTGMQGFNFDVLVPTSTGGGGVGKATSTLSVFLALDSSFAALSNYTLNGKHSSSCVLTESPTGSLTVRITMTDVIFTDLKLVNGVGFNPSPTPPVVQLTLAYSQFAIETN